MNNIVCCISITHLRPNSPSSIVQDHRQTHFYKHKGQTLSKKKTKPELMQVNIKQEIRVKAKAISLTYFAS